MSGKRTWRILRRRRERASFRHRSRSPGLSVWPILFALCGTASPGWTRVLHGQARILDLVKQPDQKHKLRSYIKKSLGRVYHSSLRHQTAPAQDHLQPFDGSLPMTRRWDALGHATLDALERSRRIRIEPMVSRTVTSFAEHSKEQTTERSLLMTLFDDSGPIGQVAILRTKESLVGGINRVENRTEFKFHSKPFANSSIDPDFHGTYATVVATMNRNEHPSSCTRCIVPISIEAAINGVVDNPFIPSAEVPKPLAPELAVLRSGVGTLPPLGSKIITTRERMTRDKEPLTFDSHASAKRGIAKRFQESAGKMPALKWITRQYNNGNILSDIKLFGMQHVVDNTAAMLTDLMAAA